jgi:hypothetical protein
VIPDVVRNGQQRDAVGAPLSAVALEVNGQCVASDHGYAAKEVGTRLGTEPGIIRQGKIADLAAVVDSLDTIDDGAALEGNVSFVGLDTLISEDALNRHLQLELD